MPRETPTIPSPQSSDVPNPSLHPLMGLWRIAVSAFSPRRQASSIPLSFAGASTDEGENDDELIIRPAAVRESVGLPNQTDRDSVVHIYRQNIPLNEPSTVATKKHSSLKPADAKKSSKRANKFSRSPSPAIKKRHRFSDLLSSFHSDDEVSDEDISGQDSVLDMESHKSLIFYLFSQLHIGMDLTKVVLPTFILERKSLLELFAGYLTHTYLLLQLPEIESKEERMMKFVKWYLTSFHNCIRTNVAKKPYNPVIGEHFQCSYRVPSDYINGGTFAGQSGDKRAR